MLAPPEFADIIPTLYAPLGRYVSNVIPLMLSHTWQQTKLNLSSSFDELVHCGWIGRLITLDSRVLQPVAQNEIHGWPATRDLLIQCIDECDDETGLDNMTNKCMEVVLPIIAKRFIENYRFPPRKFHCWWYTIHDGNTHVAIHLVNAYQPASPFDHLHHFVSTLLQAVEDAIKNYPGIRIVSCGSWLNQLPKFQHLWPESFKHGQKTLNETGGFGPGAWGQYMTSNGGFNEKNANELKRTGRHPFALTEAKSPVDEVLHHLKELVAKTGVKS